MWTIADNGVLINLEAVRSIGVEVTDDRQYVEVQVRWAADGERAAIVTLIVQDFDGVKSAMDAAWKYVEAIKDELATGGKIFSLPNFGTPTAAE